MFLYIILEGNFSDPDVIFWSFDQNEYWAEVKRLKTEYVKMNHDNPTGDIEEDYHYLIGELEGQVPFMFTTLYLSNLVMADQIEKSGRYKVVLREDANAIYH